MPYVVAFLDKEYLLVYSYVFWFFVLSTFLYGISLIPNMILFSLKRDRLNAVGAMSGVVCFLICIAFCIPSFGEIGLLFGVLAGWSAMLIFKSWFAIKCILDHSNVQRSIA